MGRIYLLNDKYPIPGYLLWIFASWAISLAVFTAMGIAVWMIWGEPDHNLLDAYPGYISMMLGIWGVYTGVGAMLLWIAMWIYWARIEKSSLSVRTGCFLVLLFGMHYGALVYAFYLWKAGRIKTVTSHPVVSGAQ
jgi:hypothetical protein